MHGETLKFLPTYVSEVELKNNIGIMVLVMVDFVTCELTERGLSADAHQSG